ncbi:MAG: hypothetical protein AB7L66_04810, partial [Gemmatimonadales bacterium]
LPGGLVRLQARSALRQGRPVRSKPDRACIESGQAFFKRDQDCIEFGQACFKRDQDCIKFGWAVFKAGPGLLQVRLGLREADRSCFKFG